MMLCFVFQDMLDANGDQFLRWWGNSSNVEQLLALNADVVPGLASYLRNTLGYISI